MVVGNPKKIDLATSSFKAMRTNDNLYVDKTRFIENFLNEPNSVQLLVRQRRLGKSLNMDMLGCFLTDKENNSGLFKGMYIENSSVWTQINSAPVFLFDFKNLKRENYKEQIWKQVIGHIYKYIGVDNLVGFQKFSFDNYVNSKGDNPEGLLILTEVVYEITGKRSYILIDEYDKLLTDNYNSEFYDEIKRFETHFLSAGLKGNNYLQKALLTGVVRVSRESILSGLNNLQIYDLFSDDIYIYDLGLTNSEINTLNDLYSFDKSLLADWYNGIKINGSSIYNIFSVLSYLQKKRFKNYWGRSGTIDVIINLMNESRRDSIEKLLNGEIIKTYLNDRISLHELTENPSDSIFYSLLVQTGYLSLEDIDESNYGTVKIPNRELMNVWKEFILSSFVKNENKIRTIFDNINSLDIFDRDVEYFLNDRLSYFDIAESASDKARTSERIYHVFVLGLLSAYEDIEYKKPISNRESGDGRYDILFERKDFCIVFEFKSVLSRDELALAAEEGLKQIDEKRYFADVSQSKPLIKTAIAFCGKQCMVKSQNHIW